MDRDIEQAADLEVAPIITHEEWMEAHAPAGRGDATRPDPATIEQVARLLWEWDGRTYPFERSAAGPAYLELAQRIAGVIVPATAEHIAAKLAPILDQAWPDPTEEWDATNIADFIREIRVAAGLSAGATDE